MFKKLFAVLSLSAFLTSLSFATDLLAFYSNGKLTEKSPGVKVLSLEEKKQVKGGYKVTPIAGSAWGNRDEYYAFVTYSTQELHYLHNYQQNLPGKKGLCPMGVETCSNPSLALGAAYINVATDIRFFPVYIVKREIQYSRYGQPFVVFKYSTGAMDMNMRLYKFNSTTSSSHLNYNTLIKEVANSYKSDLESRLGGWFVR